ncbi:hypothetical protein [Teredinibacter sp. KSP-S5-2]|uniref:hypothetical protein n=1 Tax=Teredinibacter sp. KSP-S5-2 TaxID=3034506 RepID=UPI0029341878|nr:hypothetical protein [Teredinibacter sp. KSP-S5-2]WNO10670.1 hypothetical protein P5V12_05730 [Teredinibacter sp. KSP-S5-2]
MQIRVEIWGRSVNVSALNAGTRPSTLPASLVRKIGVQSVAVNYCARIHFITKSLWRKEKANRVLRIDQLASLG